MIDTVDPKPMDGDRPEFVRLQLQMLQTEYLDLVSKMNNNETYSLSGVTAVFAALLLQDFGSFEWFLALGAPAFAMIGYLRARDMYRHLSALIEHIKMLEANFIDDQIHWYNRFHVSVPRPPVSAWLERRLFPDSEAAMQARLFFWPLLFLASLGGIYLVLTADPQPTPPTFQLVPS